MAFRKSFKIAPGTRVTLTRRGASVSAGPRGLRHSINSRGEIHRTTSIPGTGIYNRERLNPRSSNDQLNDPGVSQAIIEHLEDANQREEQRIANLSVDERRSQGKMFTIISGAVTVGGVLLWIGGWHLVGGIFAVLGVAQFFGLRKRYK